MLRRNRKARAATPLSAGPQHNHRRNIIGPLAGEAGTAEADEERAPAGAVEISRHPVAAVLAAVREVAPADGFGVGAERGGDLGSEGGPATPEP